MLDATNTMPEYQWKLTIVERNLQPANWIKLVPEAQEQMLWEADLLIEDLPSSAQSQLLTALETLQAYVEEDLQPKIQQIFCKYSSHDVHKVLEFSLKNTMPAAV